jgi:hypothetical protein
MTIEDLAGHRFAGLGLIDESLDVGFPTAELDGLIRAGQVWVACDATDRPVGMVIASVREDAVYVEEMDVLAEHGRRWAADSSKPCVMRRDLSASTSAA